MARQHLRIKGRRRANAKAEKRERRREKAKIRRGEPLKNEISERPNAPRAFFTRYFSVN